MVFSYVWDALRKEIGLRHQTRLWNSREINIECKCQAKWRFKSIVWYILFEIYEHFKMMLNMNKNFDDVVGLMIRLYYIIYNIYIHIFNTFIEPSSKTIHDLQCRFALSLQTELHGLNQWKLLLIYGLIGVFLLKHGDPDTDASSVVTVCSVFDPYRK